MRRVIDDGPWLFESTTLVCRPLLHGENPMQVPLDTVDLWVQVYDFPMGYCTDRVLKREGAFLECLYGLTNETFRGLGSLSTMLGLPWL